MAVLRVLVATASALGAVMMSQDAAIATSSEARSGAAAP
jgi:hypothetical protein